METEAARDIWEFHDREEFYIRKRSEPFAIMKCPIEARWQRLR
jgi:hypothetical protein